MKSDVFPCDIFKSGYKKKLKKIKYGNDLTKYDQLQNTLDVDLVTQAHLHTCVLTYNKVIIRCMTH